MQELEVVEGRPIDVDPVTGQAVRDRLAALQHELRPRLPFIEASGALVVRNLVGSVQIRPDLILSIRPKTEPGQDWAAALIDLLVDERAAFDVESHRGERASRLLLPSAMAGRYADALEHALTREGPLLVLERRDSRRSALRGRLDVTTWVETRALDPAMFAQSETVLTSDNSFTQAMAWVAELLATRCGASGTARRLRLSKQRLRPGTSSHVHVDPGVALRSLPAQWRSYQPAWAIARAVIRRVTPIHRAGSLDGVGLAVEPWPLLERLLRRSLEATAQAGLRDGVTLAARGHSSHALLSPCEQALVASLERLHQPRSVVPDATLWRGRDLVASFEAKYSVATSERTFRSHYFQALTTAAAIGSPLAVLVYPEDSPPVEWEVEGFNGRPGRLVAVGLNMYGYRRGPGEQRRGELLYRVVAEPAHSASPLAPSRRSH